MFAVLGPGSFLAFGDVMCAVAAVVFAALWYIGRRTPRHIGESHLTWSENTIGNVRAVSTGPEIVGFRARNVQQEFVSLEYDFLKFP